MARVLTPDDIQGSAENRDHARDEPRRRFSVRQLAAPVSLLLAGFVGWHIPALLANQPGLLRMPTPWDSAKPDPDSKRDTPPAPKSSGQIAALPPPVPQATQGINDRPVVIVPLPAPYANNNGGARTSAPPVAPERAPASRPEQRATTPAPPVREPLPPAPSRPPYQYPHNEWLPGTATDRGPVFRGPLFIRPRPGVPWRPGGFGGFGRGVFGRR
jgi:hypothetical protein